LAVPEVEAFTQIISNVGFPIFIALYLLLRFEKKLDANTESNDRLHDAIEKMLAEFRAVEEYRRGK